MSDPVKHPDHYNWMDIECIDVVQHFNFNVGNAIKYLWRAGWKDSRTHIEDLEKAKFYIEQEIGLLKAKALHPATKSKSPVEVVREAHEAAIPFGAKRTPSKWQCSSCLDWLSYGVSHICPALYQGPIEGLNHL